MDRFRMWFANMMQGRYGTDELNKAILILAFVLMALTWFIHLRIIRLLMVAALIIFYCRMMSRNYSARGAENQRWLAFIGKFRSGNKGGSGGNYGSQTGGYRDNRAGDYKSRNNNAGSRTYNAGGAFTSDKDPNHKVLRCPGCGEKLRVPKGKGKIKIKCPHCNTEFVKKV